VFKLTELPFEAYAASLGLPGAPQIKFVEQAQSQSKKNALRAGQVKAIAPVVNVAAEIETPTVLEKSVDADEEDESAEEDGESEEADLEDSDDDSASEDEGKEVSCRSFFRD
jgi:ATP-dependent RNA helicase DDX10/DBP4